MKVIKWLLIVIVIVAVGLVGVGLLLPSKFRVERSTTINAPAEKIYGLVADPKAWGRWTVWNKRDPAMKIAYSGPPSGVGAKWSWESKTEGNGIMEFTRADPPKVVEFNLSFPDMKMTSQGSMVLEPSAASTKVTWSNYGDLGGNPLVRYFGLVMDRMVGPDFEAGLAGLKALAEKP
jgi:uncharacterized protein YndB with AHSA1/START domain